MDPVLLGDVEFSNRSKDSKKAEALATPRTRVSDPGWRDGSLSRAEVDLPTAARGDLDALAAAVAPAYAAAVEFVDARVGEVLAAVDFATTTVIFAADHGVSQGHDEGAEHCHRLSSLESGS